MEQVQPNGGGKPPIVLRWHGDADPYADRAWLVRDLVFETGTGLISGQWGSGKTFGALDLSASVMTGLPFVGRKVSRQGGVLFIAPEGAFEIPIRLRGLVQGKLNEMDGERLPFAWIDECPRLLDPSAVDELAAFARQAAERMQADFDLPLALIIIDTVAAGAGFEDENSSAEGQRLMNALAALSRLTGAFVMGVDHFGKAVESGTRGTSAKEAGADVVLAMLGQRDDTGAVSNTRMAVRKLRGGRSGYAIPYKLDPLQVGENRDGEPVTTCIVTWGDTGPAAPTAKPKPKWPNLVFRDAVLNALAEHGQDAWPYPAEGGRVRAITVAQLRAEFIASYPSADAKADTKRKAFTRSIEAAADKKLIICRELKGEDHLWLASDDT
ncbi:ATP-binding protein [Methylobacterium radiotolerans]|uniref:AAA domain-containing protein n=1 Tax=Methylobacterium radiotolerans (strain ATCC 27329 / DSM 1819 / JCM 2831 / NBRC 15690 / NCIMB 10815 / 0-1) TaxID=426355 RepID=B1M1E4_METRJ|nr:AAA family ATPase [Methylobacterium radiotolerans]ACB26119.1 hypothetical protein Mrad2831_4150 [Methylobacterium radiotolerans JCM 2831]